MKKIFAAGLTAIIVLSTNVAIAQDSIRQSGLSEDKRKEISEVEAVDMVWRYKKKRYNRVRKFPLVGRRFDSRTFWYSITELKDIIKKAEDLKSDGIRMYYGVYRKKTTYAVPAREYDYSKLHTLIFVPTKKCVTDTSGKVDCYHIDQTYSTSSALMDSVVILLNLKINADGDVIADNHGELCPPPKGCNGALLLTKAESYKQQARQNKNMQIK